MNKLLLSFLLLIINGFSYNAYSQTPVTSNVILDNAFVTDLDLALKISKDTKQNVVVIFSANWCGHCRTLKNDLPSIKGFDNKIICILDSDKEKKITRQFKVKSLPTSVMLNPNGQEINRISGYNKTSYEQWLKNK